MALLSDISFSTLKRSYEAIKEEMVSRISFFTPEWTDRSLSDPGMALINVFAWVLDAYHWVAEMLLNEAFLGTAKRRTSLLLHLEQLGTSIKPPSAATDTITFTVESISPSLAPGGASLKAGYRVQAALPDDNIVFETLAAVDLPTTEGDTVSVSVREQQSLSSPLVLGNSNGKPFQRFIVPSTTVLHNQSQRTIRVRVNGVEWEEKDSLSFSTGSDQHFMVRRDQDKYPIIIFGDDSYGAIPPAPAPIDVFYADGGGERGNKASEGTISQIISPVPLGYRLTVSNAGASGGGDWEEFEAARKRGPKYWASQDRAISKDDYEGLALGVPEVLHARAEPSAYSVVQLWIVPRGGGQASTEIRQAVENAVVAHKITDTVVVGQWDPDQNDYRSVFYVPIDITVNLRVTSGYSQSITQSKVITAVSDWLAPEQRTFGELPFGYLYLSDFFELVEAVEGVSSLDVGRFNRRPVANWTIKSGDVSFSDFSLLQDSTPEEKWFVEFISPSVFKVRGDILGGQGLGQLDQTFICDYFSFKLLTGATQMREGDTFWFRTSHRVDNIPLEPKEFPTAGIFKLNIDGGY